MPIAIIEHGLGPILLALSAPQPAAEQMLVVAVPEGRFDLARVARRSGAGLGLAPQTRRASRFPTELPILQAEDGFAPPAFVWSPTASSVLRIDPAKVRYRLLF
ncbi:MAG: hypothetical protein ACKOPM_12215 [Novosphingobium sp.]